MHPTRLDWRTQPGGQPGIAKSSVIASIRAVVQLGIVSVILVYALAHLWAACLFTLLMFAIAVRTTANRSGVGKAWIWAAVAMLAGVIPVLLIIFATGCAPFSPASLIPVAGIIIGNIMSGHTLACRRFFADLREGIGIFEAGLAVGFPRRDAIALVTEPSVTESVLPTVDRTATVGLDLAGRLRRCAARWRFGSPGRCCPGPRPHRHPGGPDRHRGGGARTGQEGEAVAR